MKRLGKQGVEIISPALQSQPPDHEFVDDTSGRCMQCGFKEDSIWHTAADYWARQHRHAEADRAGHP